MEPLFTGRGDGGWGGGRRVWVGTRRTPRGREAGVVPDESSRLRVWEGVGGVS